MNKYNPPNGIEIRFDENGKPTKRRYYSPSFIKPIERIDEMTTIYDIDELQKENDRLKKQLLKVAKSLADCLHNDGGISFPDRMDCIYAKRLLEEIK
jgi:hypothetical protein